jgi:hypothetical protein
MTQLANANLLDDDLANGSSLRNKRLNKVAQRAANPVPKKPKVVEEKIEEDEEEISNNPEVNDDEYKETERYSAPKSSFYADQQRYFNENNKSNGNSKVDDEKKILGMKPALFYGILAVGALVGGYIVYKKFFSKGKKLDAKPLGSNPTPTTTTPNVAGNAAPTDLKIT